MALQKTNVSLNLGNGMDQKSDNKVGSDNQYADMKDWIYKKIGKIYKRFGTNKYSATVSTTYPNPLTIGTSTIPSSTFAYKDQLLMQNKGALYSWYENQSLWNFKGHHYPVEVESETAVANENQSSLPTSYYANGFRYIVYFVQDPLVSTTNYLKYTVIEQSTGNILVDDQQIDTTTVSLPQTFVPNIIAFASKTYLIYQNGTNIKIAEFNTTTGILGSTSNLVTNCKASSSSQYNVVASIVANKTGVGERGFIVYLNTSNQLTLLAITNAGIIDTNIPTYTVAVTLEYGFAIEFNTVTNVLFVANSEANQFYVRTFDFTSTTLTLNTSMSSSYLINSYTSLVKGIDLCRSPINTDEVYMLITIGSTNYYSQTTPFSYQSVTQNLVYSGVVSTTAFVAVPSYLVSGFVIAAKSYCDTLRNTIYSFIANDNGLQRSLFMIDRMKGKTEAAPFVQAKFQYGQAFYIDYPTSIPQLSKINNKLYFSYTKIIDGNVGNPISFIQSGTNLSQALGVGEAFIDLAPELSESTTFLGDAIHTSGGYLGYYDGSNHVESSYFLDPEFVELNIVDSAVARVGLTTTQQGTVTLPEITKVVFKNGPLQLSGPTYYWTYSTPSTTYNVYYVIDGVGTAPGVAGTMVRVTINRGDTTYQVMMKTYDAIKSAGNTIVAILSLGSLGEFSFTITNLIPGVSTDASAANYIGIGSISTLSDGSYQYCAVWKYFDNNGQLIRSAPSIPITITVTVNDIIGAVVFVPTITNRNVSTIRVEWYRTKVNGTTFYKVTNTSEDIAWSLTKAQSGYADIKSDASITASPELLYNNGGILDNYQIPAVKHVSVFKNRIIASGVDDPTAFYYSKTAIAGAPVEFAAEMFVQVDIDSDPITGHSQLDDKLIIFKETKIYYLAGDGANDLGQGSSFSLPTLVATDVGCTSHNSIVKTPLGLMFKSQKGIYLLDRALQLSYIGKEVEDYNSTQVMGAKLLAEDNQVRFTLKTGFTLVYDYLFNRWTSFSQYGGDGATIWKDKFARVDNSGRIYVEDKSIWIDNGSTVTSYSPTIMTKWLQVKDLQNYSRIYRLAILGDLKSAHTLNYKLYYDYDVTNYDEYNFSSALITGSQYDDTVYQPVIHLKRQKCDAMMVVITVIPGTGTQECLELVDMSFTVGLKEGLQKVKASKKI